MSAMPPGCGWPGLPASARPLRPDARSDALERLFSRASERGTLIEVFTLSEGETRELYALLWRLLDERAGDPSAVCEFCQATYQPGRHAFTVAPALAAQALDEVLAGLRLLIARNDGADELMSLRRERVEARRELRATNEEAEALVAKLSRSRARAAALGARIGAMDQRIQELARPGLADLHTSGADGWAPR